MITPNLNHMPLDELLKILRSVEPARHIISGRRGSEENVKIKIVIPILQYLGFDVTSNMDFEFTGADIVIVNENKTPILIIETKAWGQQLPRHLNQCLEYALKLETPLFLISSGQHTSLYSCLVSPCNLEKTAPIIDFSFSDLIGENGGNILEELKRLISKDSLLSGSVILSEKITKQLQSSDSLENANQQFISECKNFMPVVKTSVTDDDEFVRNAQKHSKEIIEILCFAKDEIKRIAHENKSISLRYGGTGVGLEYLLLSKPRSKIIGLVDINPKKARIGVWVNGWRQLNITEPTLLKLKQFNSYPKNRDDVNKLVLLLELAIKEIK